MTQEPMVVAGLTFTPAPLTGVSAFVAEYSKNNGLAGPRGGGRVICLIQDKNTLRYEAKTSLSLYTIMHLIASGKCSVHLQRLYPGKVLENIHVWVAKSDGVVFAPQVMIALIGQWIDTKKETNRAKYWADRLIRWDAEDLLSFKTANPVLFKRACEFRDLEQYLPKKCL